MRRKCIVLCMVLMLLITTVLPTNNVYAKERINTRSNVEKSLIEEVVNQRGLNVLEIQPSGQFELSKDLIAKQFVDVDKVSLTQVTMNQFISSIEEVKGKYDIIYIGNNGSKYRAYGNEAEQSKIPRIAGDNSRSKEFKSGIDITNLKAEKIKSMIEAGQVVVLDKEIFTNKSIYQETKLYKQFKPYYDKNNKYKSLRFIGNINAFHNITSEFKNNNIRPLLAVNVPDEISSNTFTIAFNVYNVNSEIGGMTANLYLDFNGDGLYKEDEKFGVKENINNHKDLKTVSQIDNQMDYSFSVVLPEGFGGYLGWKVELEDNETKIMSYEEGHLKCISESKQMIKVLQVYPEHKDILNTNTAKDRKTLDELLNQQKVGNILDLTKQLVDNDKNSLLTDNRVKQQYDIQIEKISIHKFIEEYAKDSSYTIQKRQENGVEKGYDMIIFGFADSYGSPWQPNSKTDSQGKDIYGQFDITQKNILEDIQKFIDSKQSIMFVHDTMSRPINGRLWTPGLTNEFRNQIGQKKYDEKTSKSKEKYGYTDYVLEGYDGGRVTNRTKVINAGQITSYPFDLNDSGPGQDGNIQVAKTHFQYYELDLEDEDVVVWYNLSGNGYDDHNASNFYYTYSKGNITYSGTGHSDLTGTDSEDERKMFVNTIVKASNSANHPPTLEFLNLKEGQKIPDTLETLAFKIKGMDIDPKDEDLTYEVKIYIEDNNKEIILQEQQSESKRDTEKEFIISQEAFKALDEFNRKLDLKGKFKIAVTAMDQHKAATTQTLTLYRIKQPLQVNNTMNNQYLVGDSINVKTVLKAEFNKDEIDQIKDIKLLTQVKKETDKNTFENAINQSIEIKELGGYQENTSGLVPKEAIPDLTLSNPWPKESYDYQYTLMAKQAGNYKLSSEVNYSLKQGDLIYRDQIVENEQSISVKEGKIGVKVEEENGRSVANATVIVKNKVSGLEVSKGHTDITGLYEVPLALATGTYTVKVLAPQGYTNSNQIYDAEIKISYNNPTEIVTIQVVGSPVKDVSLHVLENDDEMQEVKNIAVKENGNALKAVLKFTNLIELKYESIPLLADVDFKYKVERVDRINESKKITRVDGFEIKDSELVYNKGTILPVGSYKAVLSVTLPESSFEEERIRLKSITIQDTSPEAEKSTYAVSDEVAVRKDSIPPTITPEYNSKGWVNENVGVDILARVDGTGSNLVAIRWLEGKCEIGAFQDNKGNVLTGISRLEDISVYKNSPDIWKAKDITESGRYVEWITFKVNKNGTYTIYAKDAAGHEAVEVIYIHNIYTGELPDIS